MAFSVISTYGQEYKGFKNIGPLATKLETDGQDHPVILMKDENFGTQWAAKNDGVDTWVEFVGLSSSGRANRRSTDEYGKILREVEVNPKTSTCRGFYYNLLAVRRKLPWFWLSV